MLIQIENTEWFLARQKFFRCPFNLLSHLTPHILDCTLLLLSNFAQFNLVAFFSLAIVNQNCPFWLQYNLFTCRNKAKVIVPAVKLLGCSSPTTTPLAGCHSSTSQHLMTFTALVTAASELVWSSTLQHYMTVYFITYDLWNLLFPHAIIGYSPSLLCLDVLFNANCPKQVFKQNIQTNTH